MPSSPRSLLSEKVSAKTDLQAFQVSETWEKIWVKAYPCQKKINLRNTETKWTNVTPCGSKVQVQKELTDVFARPLLIMFER